MSKSERLKISGPPARSSPRRIEPLLRVCICGGGNLGHALAGIIGSNPAVDVRVLTRRPNEWGSIIKVYWRENHVCLGRISAVSSNARAVVSGSDVVLLALPAFARRSVLEQVRPYVGPSTWIGSIPGTEGFDWLANEVLGPKHKVFGTQRAPYVCHTVKYGQSVLVSGVRPRLSLHWISNFIVFV
jgi:opine dehydrogenase